MCEPGVSPRQDLTSRQWLAVAGDERSFDAAAQPANAGLCRNNDRRAVTSSASGLAHFTVSLCNGSNLPLPLNQSHDVYLPLISVLIILSLVISVIWIR